MKILSLQAGQFAGGGGGGGGTATGVQILTTDPVSPATQAMWLLDIPFTEPTFIHDYNSGPPPYNFWSFGGSKTFTFTISPYTPGDFLNLFGGFATVSLPTQVNPVPAAALLVRQAVSADGFGGLAVEYDPATTTTGQVLAAVNAFSQSKIGKNVLTDTGNTPSNTLAANLDGSSNNLVSDIVAESAILKIKMANVTASTPMTLG